MNAVIAEELTFDERLETALRTGEAALTSAQDARGYWCFELEADVTISAEYILMMHYMDEIDENIQGKIACYLRNQQDAQGGWRFFYGGDFDMSCSVKAYYALKLAGDSPDAPHMVRARQWILDHGGAARSNVFTHIALALFGQIPWRGVPFMPVEIMLFPRWFPFHLSKVSYWSRTVVVPMLILCSRKPRARNPRNIGVQELFIIAPEKEKNYFTVRSGLNRLFLGVDRLARRLEKLIPGRLRNKAIAKAECWFIDRLNGDGGLGAIFPAMVNAYMAMDLLGYSPSNEHRRLTRKAINDLLVVREKEAYCQPCLSPVWDTVLSCHALHQVGGRRSRLAVKRGLDWLMARQLTDQPGDWREDRPGLSGGGWPFQFHNDYYPDLDDTAAVAWIMDQQGDARYHTSVRRAADWLVGMQSKNGGFAAFDADNTHEYLNQVPFADHGALLDPPTVDVSARVAALLGRLVGENPGYRDALDRCIDYLRREQESDGRWFGRWGTNYIYGTWSVLAAMEQVGVSSSDPMVVRAADWLESVQRDDGGWGESNAGYHSRDRAFPHPYSNAFQTAWAVMGLMAAGRDDGDAVRRGIEFLISDQDTDGLWSSPDFTAPGFPRVFYLKYYGYSKYFPLWALGRYRNLMQNKGRVREDYVL